jgi:riboflavin kinase / FMN adenylyltransferase
MDVFRFSLGDNYPSIRGATLCLGTFDGFHRGHQKLVLEGRLQAEKSLGVLLFDHSPAEVLHNGKSLDVLTSLDDRLRLFEAASVDFAYLIHADTRFYELSAAEFIDKVLLPLVPSLLVVGADYRFGALAKGTPADLAVRFPIREVPLLTIDGRKVSTQSIVREIRLGKVEKAAVDLGRDYEISGCVVRGYENGRKIGFPTANLDLKAPYVLPLCGVYKGLAYSRGRPYKALINVGTNPTIGALKTPIVEAYLKDFDEEIYGETLYLSFASFVREEMVFVSLEGLKAQLLRDLEKL